MIDWFISNWGNIMVLSIVAALVVLAAGSMLKDKKAGKCTCGGSCGSCGGSCAGCAMAGKCHSNASRKDMRS